METRYLENVRLLVVEDNQFMRSILRTVLKAFGARQIDEATDGEEALKAIKVHPPDIIIVDWEMKPMNGLDLVKRVRTDRGSINPYVPIIMVSGYSEMHRITAARDVGVNEYLVKPISATMLFNRLQRVINKPRPFIRSADYFGPERRRRTVAYQGDERRNQEAEVDWGLGDEAKDIGERREGDKEARKEEPAEERKEGA